MQYESLGELTDSAPRAKNHGLCLARVSDPVKSTANARHYWTSAPVRCDEIDAFAGINVQVCLYCRYAYTPLRIPNDERCRPPHTKIS